MVDEELYAVYFICGQGSERVINTCLNVSQERVEKLKQDILHNQLIIIGGTPTNIYSYHPEGVLYIQTSAIITMYVTPMKKN